MQNGYFEPPIADVIIGTVISYQCNPGFIATGPIEATCVAKKGIPRWKTPVHKCIGTHWSKIWKSSLKKKKNVMLQPCKGLVEIEWVKWVVFLCTYSVRVFFFVLLCLNKMKIKSKENIWIYSYRHYCNTSACGPPPTVPFADVDTKGLTLVNSVRKYTCQKGYHPTGPIEAICLGEKGATFWQLTDHSCRGKLTFCLKFWYEFQVMETKTTVICFEYPALVYSWWLFFCCLDF